MVCDTILPLVDEPQKAGQYHWTAVKLCGYLREEKPLDLSYSTLVRYLHEQNYARRIPRHMPEPSDPEQWEEDREAFARQLLGLLEDPSAHIFWG